MPRVLLAAADDARGWARAHRRLAALLATAILVQVAYAVFRAAELPTCDLVRGYLVPTRGVLAGEDPFVAFDFNSFGPFFYAVLAPFALLPNAAASLLWTLLGLACLAGSLALVQAMLESPLRPPSAALAALAALTLLSDNFNLGQSNLPVLFLVLLGLFSLSRGRDAAAGGFVSLAVAFKITPALFVVYFALKRRWRAVGAAMLGLLVWLLLVPALVFGPARNLHLLSEWSEQVVMPFVSGQKVKTTNVRWHHTNQSLEAALQRTLTPYGENTYGGLHPALDLPVLDEKGASRVALVLKFLVLVTLALVALKGRSRPPRVLLEGALFFYGMLFLSPVSWYSHYVVSLVAFACALELLRQREWRQQRLLAAGLVAAVGLTTVSLTDQLRSYSLVFLGHALLFVALAVLALRPEPAVAAPAA